MVPSAVANVQGYHDENFSLNDERYRSEALQPDLMLIHWRFDTIHDGDARHMPKSKACVVDMCRLYRSVPLCEHAAMWRLCTSKMGVQG